MTNIENQNKNEFLATQIATINVPQYSNSTNDQQKSQINDFFVATKNFHQKHEPIITTLAQQQAENVEKQKSTPEKIKTQSEVSRYRLSQMAFDTSRLETTKWFMENIAKNLSDRVGNTNLGEQVSIDPQSIDFQNDEYSCNLRYGNNGDERKIIVGKDGNVQMTDLSSPDLNDWIYRCQISELGIKLPWIKELETEAMNYASDWAEINQLLNEATATENSFVTFQNKFRENIRTKIQKKATDWNSDFEQIMLSHHLVANQTTNERLSVIDNFATWKNDIMLKNAIADYQKWTLDANSPQGKQIQDFLKTVNTSSVSDSMQANEANLTNIKEFGNFVKNYWSNNSDKTRISDFLRNENIEKQQWTDGTSDPDWQWNPMWINWLLDIFTYKEGQDTNTLTAKNFDYNLLAEYTNYLKNDASVVNSNDKIDDYWLSFGFYLQNKNLDSRTKDKVLKLYSNEYQKNINSKNQSAEQNENKANQKEFDALYNAKEHSYKDFYESFADNVNEREASMNWPWEEIFETNWVKNEKVEKKNLKVKKYVSYFAAIK